MENSRFLTIRANEFNFDEEGYNYTKVLGLKCYCGGKLKITRKQPTTWASAIRETVNSFSYEIDSAVENDWEAFERRFNTALKQIIQNCGGKSNTSFSEELFTTPDHIRSTVYKNNQNSMLEIFRTPMGEPKYITAVYSGEVVWVLNALITALEDYDAWVEIEYIHREDLKQVVDELDNEERQLSIDDIPEQTENTDEIEGNAVIYCEMLKLKLGELYQSDIITDKQYNELVGYVDKLSVAVLDMKSFMGVINMMSGEVNRKLGI